MNPVSSGLNIPNRQSGFSTIELSIASVIASAGLLVSISLYSYLASRNKLLDSKRGIGSLGSALQNKLGKDLKANWLNLSKNSCNSADVTMTLSTTEGTDFTTNLLDNSALTSELPLKLSDGVTENPMRKAIDHLIANYGSTASSKCGDSTLLQFQMIGSSPKNQALCRCATAITPYGTLQTKMASATTRSGLYSCILIKPSTTHSDSQIGQLLNRGSVVMESTFSFLNLVDASSFTCSATTSSASATPSEGPANSVGRLDYVLYGGDNMADANAQSLSFPGTLMIGSEI